MMSKMCWTHVNINVIYRKRLDVWIYSDAMNDCVKDWFLSLIPSFGRISLLPTFFGSFHRNVPSADAS